MIDYETAWNDLKGSLKVFIEKTSDLMETNHNNRNELGETFAAGALYQLKAILEMMETGEIENEI